MKKFIYLLVCLFCAISFSPTKVQAQAQSHPAYLIIDGKGAHIMGWVYENVRVPKDFPADSLETSVTVCVNVSKEGKLSYIPVGDNNPTLLHAVEKVLNQDVHCVPHRKWNAETKAYDSFDYSTYLKVYFPYIKPEIMPEYTQKDLPKRWTKKNMYTAYRGTLMQSSFQQSTDLKESKEKFRSWLIDNVEYPQEAIDQNIEGDFTMTFFVNEQMKLQIIDVIESPSPLITTEVIKAVNKCGIWQPTMRWNFISEKYDYVRSSFSITLKFENPKKK